MVQELMCGHGGVRCCSAGWGAAGVGGVECLAQFVERTCHDDEPTNGCYVSSVVAAVSRDVTSTALRRLGVVPKPLEPALHAEDGNILPPQRTGQDGGAPEGLRSHPAWFRSRRISRSRTGG